MLLVAVNPTPSEFNFVTGLSGHPLRRTVIEYTSSETLMDISQILKLSQIPICDSADRDRLPTVSRVFSVFISPNIDQAADSFQGNKIIMARALSYPHNQTQLQRKDELFNLRIMDGDRQESQPDFRGYFVEPYTDQQDEADNAA